jgi:hypothetical protein
MDFPSDVTVFLIEAHTLTFGLGLSAPISASAHKVVREIQDIIEDYSSLGAAADTAATLLGPP